MPAESESPAAGNFRSRLKGLLDQTLATPLEEVTTREQLLPLADQIRRCLEAGWSRQHVYAQYTRAGGSITYNRFCRVLKGLLAEGNTGRLPPAEEGSGPGSRLLEARRNGSMGRTITALRGEQTAGLTKVANLKG